MTGWSPREHSRFGDETCCECGCATGRAGRGDDSMYCDDCDAGPFCEDCYAAHICKPQDGAGGDR